MNMLREYSKSIDAKHLHGALVIGRQPNFHTVDGDGEFMDCPDNEPGIQVDGCNKKTTLKHQFISLMRTCRVC